MRPPKYPAIRPMVTPKVAAIRVVNTPTNSEIRAPYRIRMNRSRPVPSEPSQNPFVMGPIGLPTASSPVSGKAMLGPWCVIDTNTGAAIASATMITMTASAIIDTLSRRRRRQVRDH